MENITLGFDVREPLSLKKMYPLPSAVTSTEIAFAPNPDQAVQGLFSWSKAAARAI